MARAGSLNARLMLFTSLEFPVFLAVVLVMYARLGRRFRWGLLLAASYVFYSAWRPEYLLLIVASTVVDYVAGLGLGRSSRPAARKAWVGLSLVVNLGLLALFKYGGFIRANLATVAGLFGLELSTAPLPLYLPVGISFYTFQTLAYTLDVYRGRLAPERHFGRFALYVAYFPQLVAGPIERAGHLMPQLAASPPIRYGNLWSGLMLMLWGFWKKMVVADRLALYVDAAYGNSEVLGGLPLVLGTYFFAFQIYCDFSAYSDIAIGCARIMGVDLMENFRTPYRATSIRDFWQRWHISLTTWFRDYVYIPLGGNRVAPGRWAVNVAVVFLLSGLWHGANWTFVVWGAIHAVGFLVSTRGPQRGPAQASPSPRSPSPLRAFAAWFVTFNAVTLAWVFFRADSLAQAGAVLASVADLDLGHPIGIPTISPAWFATTVGLLAVFVVLDLLKDVEGVRKVWLRPGCPGQMALAYLGLMTIYAFGVFEEQAFIYFRF